MTKPMAESVKIEIPGSWVYRGAHLYGLSRVPPAALVAGAL